MVACATTQIGGSPFDGYPTGSCPDPFMDIAGSCYYMSWLQDTSKVTWSGARRVCQSFGRLAGKDVDLAELDDEVSCLANSRLLKKMTADKPGHVWLGGSDTGSEGKWTWSKSGRDFTDDSHWYYDYPNGNGGSDVNCLAASPKGSKNRAQLGDWSCTDEYHFICQIFVSY